METLRAAGLLELWEQAEVLRPVPRALCLAAAAGADPDALRTRPFGETNRQVLALRERLMGPVLVATAACSKCGAGVEFAVEASALHGQVTGADSVAVTVDGHAVRWRVPTPDDLAAAAAEPGPGQALLRRCLITPGVESLPTHVVREVENAMAASDPLAEILVSLTCPECATVFEADLDLGCFVWAELDARARRLLAEVDVLARTYGWTEPEVLALSEHRRAAYLRVVLDGAP